MTASRKTANKRIQQNNKAAVNKATNTYNNANLSQDLEDWLESGGYEAYGNPKYGYNLRNSGGKWNYTQQNNRINDILDDFAGYQGQQLLNAVNSYGDPASYKTDFRNSNQLTDLKNSYLNSQYENALQQIEQAYKRGTLNNNGYNKALTTLGQQNSAANSTMNTAVNNMMDMYDQELGGVLNKYANQTDNYNLNTYDTYNTNKLSNEFNDTYNNLANNLEGDFYNQMAGTQLFDVSGLLGDAKVSQGVTNMQPTNELLGTIEENEQKKNKKVGLGNQGLF